MNAIYRIPWASWVLFPDTQDCKHQIWSVSAKLLLPKLPGLREWTLHPPTTKARPGALSWSCLCLHIMVNPCSIHYIFQIQSTWHSFTCLHLCFALTHPQSNLASSLPRPGKQPLSKLLPLPQSLLSTTARKSFRVWKSDGIPHLLNMLYRCQFPPPPPR